MRQNLNSILQTFETISLEEMESVKLMDRIDTKFTFTVSDLESILPQLLHDYKVLEIEGVKGSRYKTLYFDTSSFSLYTAHHNGKLNRYKIRHRTYLDSGLTFLEVKFKSNKGRTIKERIKTAIPTENWTEEQARFLHQKLPFAPDVLQAVIWVNYTRLTLVSKTSQERLTIDLNLHFEKGATDIKMDNLVIAEVKRGGKMESAFIKEVRKRFIREGSISKYCMGVAFCVQEVKKNNFKERILNLKKIISNDIITSN